MDVFAPQGVKKCTFLPASRKNTLIIIIKITNSINKAVTFIIYRNNNFKIRLGDWNSATNSEPIVDLIPISTVIHPNYNAQNLYNDIAVIRLSRSIPLSTYSNINTACLPTSIPSAGTRFCSYFNTFLQLCTIFQGVEIDSKKVARNSDHFENSAIRKNT